MTVLRVLLDPALEPATSGGRYTTRLSRALLAARPEGSSVAGVVSAAAADEVESLWRGLPALDEIHRIRLGRREVRAAWQHGLTIVPGAGLIHATDLIAPLGRHDRSTTPDSQIVVTLSDVRSWTAPDSIEQRAAARQRAMGRRAERYADAIVVPSRAVADLASAVLDVGDRIRVVAAAPRPGIRADSTRLAELRLPRLYVVTVRADDAAPPEAEARLAAALPSAVELVVVSPESTGAASDSQAAVMLRNLPDEQVSAVIAGAAAFVQFDRSLGIGLSVLDAMSSGTPVIHPGGEESRELIADAGIEAEGEDAIAAAVSALIEDRQLSERFSVLGRDRAGAFTWHDTAEKIWQLHADL